MRKRSAVGLALMLALAMAGCGGDDDASTSDPDDDEGSDEVTSESSAIEDSSADAGPGANATDETETSAADDGGSSGGGGTSTAEITVDGTTVRFAMSGLEYSPIEGVDDITLENCDPDFFGVGMWAIGYPVDENGELLLAEDGQDIAGIMEAELPFEDTTPDLMDVGFVLDYEPLGLDLRFGSNPSSEATYTIDGSSASGTVTMYDFTGNPVVVDFELSCAA